MGSSSKRKTLAGGAGDCIGDCVVVSCCCPFTILHLLVQICIKLPTKSAHKAISKCQLFKQRRRKPAAMPEILLDTDDDSYDADNGIQQTTDFFPSSSVWEGRMSEEESDSGDIELLDTAIPNTENHEQVTPFQHFYSVTSDSGFHSASMLKDY